MGGAGTADGNLIVALRADDGQDAVVAEARIRALLRGVRAQRTVLAAGVLASPTIELKDGSRIQGEIQSLENGVYTVISPNIGTVHIAQSNIVRIVYTSESANAAGSSARSTFRKSSIEVEYSPFFAIRKDSGACK